ncbi:MAG: hypothetical protein Q8M94_07825, partial [Ignavibacteria bacterium]|nr:hypothetical protein [Ignavibacteria bacterium]
LRNAPSRTASENDGRRGDYFGDYDEETRGFKAIMIYIQHGLAEYYELIREVVKLVLAVQSGNGGKYQIIPVAFGKGSNFSPLRQYFNMGYITDKLAEIRIADAIQEITGNEKSDVPAVIPDFFIKTDARSLINGKIRFEQKDLMVIIGKKSEVVFAEKLRNQFTVDIKKRILFVEIDENSVNWIFRNLQPEFI